MDDLFIYFRPTVIYYLFIYKRNMRSMVHIAHFSKGVLKQVKPYPKLNCCLV